MKSLGNLEVYAYILDDSNEFPVLLVKLKTESGIRWAIRCFDECMNKNGLWEYELMPSHRDDEFYKRCRFMQSGEAYDVYKKSIGE
jgi:hypothetical protein